MKSGKIGRIRLDPAKHQVFYGQRAACFGRSFVMPENESDRERGRQETEREGSKRAIKPFPFVIKGAGKEKISEGRSGRGRSPGKTKRPGGPQRTKKGPQTLTGRIWDIRHISCLKKRCDLSVSAGTLSIAQFVRSYNPILEIYPNFFWRCADRGNFAAFSPGPAEPKEHRSTFVRRGG